jgi:predicted RNA-binding Zn ribbon-like protein
MHFGDEELLLALLNSAPTDGGVQLDELAGLGAGTAVPAWLARHGGAEGASVAALRAARADLWAVVRGDAAADTLVRHLAGVAAVPEPGPEGLAWQLRTPPGREAAVAAVLAWSELAASAPGRVRACGNPECTLFLIDRSKSNSARWCSMAVCGNRMKARRHHERARAEL